MNPDNVDGPEPVDARADRDPPSPIEDRMAAFTLTPSEEMLQRILAILGTGRRSATYKPALLLALVELSVERAPVDGGALALPLRDVAERVLELYWPSARPYPGMDGVLKQATMPNSRIGVAVAELRALAGSAGRSLGQLRSSHPEAVGLAVDRIAKALAMQPVPRLQRPGEATAGSDYLRFLFDDSRYRTEQGALDRDPVIELRPGIAGGMARNAALIRMAAQAAWVQELVAINRLKPEEHSLREFLFGADRTALGRVAGGLADLQGGRCFYCEAGLPTSYEIDHVIPWSLNPNDDLFNLVAADRHCNAGKRDRLLIGEHVTIWTARDRRALSELGRERDWPVEPARTAAVARAAYTSLAEGIPAWQGPGQVVPFAPAHRVSALAAIDTLQADLGRPA